MNALEKIQKLADKKDGLGIPMTIIGKYCGCHPNSITYYIKGAPPRPEVLESYEYGLKQLLYDMQEIIKG